MAVKKSVKEFARAKNVMTGGVNSPVRAFKSVGGSALVMDRGKGQKLFDIDGNGYVDYCLSWGALILGHAHKDVVRAVTKGIRHAVSFGTTTKPEIEIAQFIVKNVPSVDKIRFVNSGTEATMSAIRLARGFTKRDIVVKFDGCYHGHVDDLLTTAGSGVASLHSSSSQGIPQGHIQNTISLPYNDTEILKKTFDDMGTSIACVILEPVAGNMGVIVPDIEFLKALRSLTKKHGSVLIFDEVMTGFRTSLSCVQSEFGIIPDVTCFGKIIGGGFPVGAYGGRKDIMAHLAPEGSVYQAGTFSGNPIVMRAGLATLKNLNAGFYRKLNKSSDQLAQTLNKIFRDANKDAHVSSYKSMISFRFRREIVVNYTDAQAASSNSIYAKLFHHFLKNRIYMPPADLESFFISAAHTSKDLKHLSDSVKSFSQFC